MRSRVMGDYQARFCERFRGETPLYLLDSDMFPKKTIGTVIGIGGLAGGVGAVSITKLGGALFDHYKALGHIETGYTIMFAICAVAYLVAWGVMKMLVPKYRPIGNL
jgi:ACS family hexuronate transporter-like MFS transporter